MRKLIAASLLGACFVGATSLLVPAGASARGLYDGGRCEGWRARFSWSCRSSRSSSARVVGGVAGIAGVPTDPPVPEPGGAALFALGAALVAARSRRVAR